MSHNRPSPRRSRKLEEELGGELFRRERKRTKLTDLGRLMKPHIEAIQRASEAVKADAMGYTSQEQATIKLGVMSTIGPSRMVGFIARLHDEIPQLDLALREAPGRDLVEALLDGEIEAGLIGMPNLPDRLHSIPLYSRALYGCIRQRPCLRGYERGSIGGA